MHRLDQARAAAEKIRGFGFYLDREGYLLDRLRAYDDELARTPTHFAVRRLRQQVTERLAVVREILDHAERGRALAGEIPQLEAEIAALRAQIAAEDR